jgi:hypothetical protein
MRPVRITTRRLMVGVAAAAVLLHPVIGPGPDEPGRSGWALEMALVNALPIAVLAWLFRLRRARLMLVMLASASIAVAQVVFRVPPNLSAPVAYLTVAGIAHLARDPRELTSGIVAVACGVIVGLACGWNPCTPGIEMALASLTGIAVKKALGSGKRPPSGHAVAISADDGDRPKPSPDKLTLYTTKRRDFGAERGGQGQSARPEGHGSVNLHLPPIWVIWDGVFRLFRRHT